MDENGKVTARGETPLITPPKSKKGEKDIAFAASAVIVKDEIWLYDTTADKTTYRAIITVVS
ncbi:hypothetical protein [Mucilaginibacter sp. UYCu711]|uniref:hypothetical protein n=1 Tax=Mucilaginibacter sp. UYCu711 TaxID=3156339 RepID=UPI003D218A31